MHINNVANVISENPKDAQIHLKGFALLIYLMVSSITPRLTRKLTSLLP